MAREADLATWPQRVEGARLRAQRAQAAHGRFAAERLDDLLSERQEVATQARDGLAQALTGVVTAHREWNVAAADTRNLLGLAGRADLGAAVPSLAPELDEVELRTRRYDRPVPLPMPRESEPVVAHPAAAAAALTSPASRRFTDGPRAA